MLFSLLMPVIAATLIWGFRQFRHSPLFRVQGVRVERCAQVSPQEVTDLLKLEADSNILLLDLSELAERARSHPWVQEASIGRRLPHTLVVKIEERRPACVLLGANPYLVSEDGMILASLKGRTVADLPSFRLAEGGDFRMGERIDSSLFQRGQYFWRDLQQFLKGSAIQIREIYQAKDGSLSVSLGGGMPSLRLRPESLEEQAPRLMSVISRYGPGWRSLEYIDLRFSGKIILKPVGKGGGGLGKG